MLFALALTLVAAALYFGIGWLQTDESGTITGPRPDAQDNAIPLALPAAPPGYGAGNNSLPGITE
ncbi:MAG: hypothetical protein WBG92_19330 [Thiohalocapsa sp.]